MNKVPAMRLTPTLANAIATEEMEKDEMAMAKIGSHKVNGKTCFMVHITYKDHIDKPRTIGKV